MNDFQREMFDLQKAPRTASGVIGSSAETMQSWSGPAGSGNSIVAINQLRVRRHSELYTMQLAASRVAEAMEIAGIIVANYEGANDSAIAASKSRSSSAEQQQSQSAQPFGGGIDPSHANSELNSLAVMVSHINIYSPPPGSPAPPSNNAVIDVDIPGIERAARETQTVGEMMRTQDLVLLPVLRHMNV